MTPMEKRTEIAWLLMAAGGLLVFAGVIGNQPALVMAKAIRICLECVGIG